MKIASLPLGQVGRRDPRQKQRGGGKKGSVSVIGCRQIGNYGQLLRESRMVESTSFINSMRINTHVCWDIALVGQDKRKFVSSLLKSYFLSPMGWITSTVL